MSEITARLPDDLLGSWMLPPGSSTEAEPISFGRR